MKWLFYIILIAGAGNTVLRPEMDNPLTLYRILAPIGLFAVFALRPRLVVKYSIWFVLFAMYNLGLATLYGKGYSELVSSLVHYMYIWILLVLMLFIFRVDHKFDESFLIFVKWFFIFILANLVLELFIGSYYPNLYVDTSGDGSIRAFYWNQNDLAVVICTISWICLAYDRYNGIIRIIVVGLTLIILFINDSKAALLSMIAVSLPVFMMMRTDKRRYRLSNGVWVGLFVFIFTSLVIVMYSIKDYPIKFESGTYSINDLLVNPILGIFSLTPTGEEWGSINNRMDAAIFVLIEYFRSYGLGLGAGGSWLVLSLPQYYLKGAQSPHNALLQFVVDFGFPVLLGYIYLVRWSVQKIKSTFIDQRVRLQVIAILSFPFIGLSQSGAIVTNYMFWAVAFFIWLQGVKKKEVVKTGNGGA